MPEALARARAVRLMIFDVDGVLTDGRLWYGPAGEQTKVFHSLDGHGIRMLAASGVAVAILSGRSSEALTRRAAELGIDTVLQGIADKRPAFEQMLRARALDTAAAGYMGDDVVDLPVLTRCGFASAPHEAPAFVRERVHYVAQRPAGAGAAREVCEYIMQSQGTLAAALARYAA